MKEALHRVFNWKRYPASVFLLAIPLFIIGFGCMGLVAYLQWRVNGDLVYAAIYAVAIIVLAALLVSSWYRHQQIVRMSK